MIKVIASPNIAFIKYWGKKEFTQDQDRNIGLNPSLSMTLSRAQTTVTCRLSETDHFLVNKAPVKEKDLIKLSDHIQRIADFFQLPRKTLHIESSNNFPTGTGIASSASAYAALTLAISACLLGKERFIEVYENRLSDFINLARRGSGSAARSLEGPFVYWNDKKTQVLPYQWKLYDTVLIFSSTEKKVSSTDGHKYAPLSPLFPERLQKLELRTQKLIQALEKQNLHQLGPLLEEEADEMHNVMRSSTPPIEYQSAECRQFLSEIKKQAQRDFYYTLDAGPNVHIISEKPVVEILKKIMKDLDISAEIWEDEQGYGPSWEFTN